MEEQSSHKQECCGGTIQGQCCSFCFGATQFPREEPVGPLPGEARALPWPSGDRTGTGLGAPELNRQIFTASCAVQLPAHLSSLLPAFPREQTLWLRVGGGVGKKGR